MRLLGQRQRTLLLIAQWAARAWLCLHQFPCASPWHPEGYTNKLAHLVGCLMREGNWVGWPGVLEHEVSKPVLCPGERYYLTLKVSRCKHNPEKWPSISQDLRLLTHPLYWVEWWPPSKIYPSPQICECYLIYTEGLWRLPCESVGRNLNGETTSGEGSEVSKSY